MCLLSEWKAVSFTYCECVLVALGIRHELCMNHIAIWGLPGYTVLSTLSQSRHYFWYKFTDQIIVFWISLQRSSRTFRFLRRNEQDLIKMYIDLHLKVHLVNPIIMKLEFSCQVSKILNCQFLWNYLQLEQICYMRADRQTDMKKVIVAFRNFAKARNNSYNPSNFPIMCSWNTPVCAADSSWYSTVTGLWYWVADLCECCNWRDFV